MGSKNVKEHYRIGHTVQIRGGIIAIGSAYVHDLIRVTFAGAVTWGTLGRAANSELCRYFDEMTADPATLLRLIREPDTFTADLRVYTYQGGEIIGKYCEAYGWPNICHDGQLQYENTHSSSRDQVVRWAKLNAQCGIENCRDSVAQAEKEVERLRGYLRQHEADRLKLDTDFPDVPLTEGEE